MKFLVICICVLKTHNFTRFVIWKSFFTQKCHFTLWWNFNILSEIFCLKIFLGFSHQIPHLEDERSEEKGDKLKPAEEDEGLISGSIFCYFRACQEIFIWLDFFDGGEKNDEKKFPQPRLIEWREDSFISGKNGGVWKRSKGMSLKDIKRGFKICKWGVWMI